MHVECRLLSCSRDKQTSTEALLEDINDMALDSSEREESEIIRHQYTACFATPSHYLKHLNNAKTQQLLVDDIKEHLWRMKSLTDKTIAEKYIDSLF
jgi:tRNA U34 5-carboxymethylaminomethyl modifying GTPase MnmE/TrmE